MRCVSISEDLRMLEAQARRAGRNLSLASGASESSASVEQAANPELDCSPGSLPGHPQSTPKLIEFGRNRGLGFHRTLHLALKGEWEAYVRQAHVKYRGADVSDPVPSKTALHRLKAEFNSDIGGLFEEFESSGGWVSAMGYSEPQFQALIQHLIRVELQFAANDSREAETYFEQEAKQLRLVKSAPPKLRDRFIFKELQWLDLVNEYADALVARERRRLEGTNLEHQWLLAFGTVYIAWQESAHDLDGLKRRIATLKANPKLTVIELADAVAETEAQERKKLDAPKLPANFAAGPLDTQIELVIEGEELADMVAWLDRAIEGLEAKLTSLRAGMRAMSRDPDPADRAAPAAP